jgi:hypothetical protein
MLVIPLLLWIMTNSMCEERGGCFNTRPSQCKSCDVFCLADLSTRTLYQRDTNITWRKFSPYQNLGFVCWKTTSQANAKTHWLFWIWHAFQDISCCLKMVSWTPNSPSTPLFQCRLVCHFLCHFNIMSYIHPWLLSETYSLRDTLITCQGCLFHAKQEFIKTLWFRYKENVFLCYFHPLLCLYSDY